LSSICGYGHPTFDAADESGDSRTESVRPSDGSTERTPLAPNGGTSFYACRIRGAGLTHVPTVATAEKISELARNTGERRTVYHPKLARNTGERRTVYHPKLARNTGERRMAGRLGRVSQLVRAGPAAPVNAMKIVSVEQNGPAGSARSTRASGHQVIQSRLGSTGHQCATYATSVSGERNESSDVGAALADQRLRATAHQLCDALSAWTLNR
jgi:hypothetical protein